MLAYAEVEKAAEGFRMQHGLITVPVDIERAVEHSLAMDIIPLPGLRREFQVDGFLASDFSAIYVDDYMISAYPERYRFTLAHEVGHRVLHEQIYAENRMLSVEEYRAFLAALPAQKLDAWEADANNFAGCVLMPPKAIEAAYSAQVKRAAGLGARVDAPTFNSYAAEPLSKQFSVSAKAVEIRLARLRLKP